MSAVLRIVLIEDVDTDAELIQRVLRKADIHFEASQIESGDEFEKILTEPVLPDLILSDYSLPRFNAIEALELRNKLAPDIPFILVTGAQTEEIAVNCIKKGADDYLLKASLTRLPTSVLNVLNASKTKKERKDAVLQLRLREEKYRNLFEGSMVGMLRWRLTDGVIVEYNHKAKEYTKLFCDENNLFHDCFLNEDDYKNIKAHLLETGVVENVEFPVKSKNPYISWLSLSARLYVEEGIVEGILQDISASKESMIELQKVNYELDRFVYHASHDLKSPLRSIMGLVEAARESETLEECFTYIEMFEQCATKLEVLVSDLLMLARANRAEENITSFDFDREIQACLSLIAHTDRFKKIRIKIDTNQPIAFHTDAVRLRIILNNLITNAVKYHRIDQADPYLHIKTEVDKNKAVFTVTDNGEGIAEHHIPRLFDMFYRASKTSEGSGLGLYLVKSMIEKIGGKVSVTSQLHSGTSFVVEIPNLINIE